MSLVLVFGYDTLDVSCSCIRSAVAAVAAAAAVAAVAVTVAGAMVH